MSSGVLRTSPERRPWQSFSGVFVCRTLLLVVCGVLNVSMWLWICSTAIFGIMGTFTVDGMVLADSAAAGHSERDARAGASDEEGQDCVRHLIVFPNYKEDEEMLRETLQSLKEARGSADFWVVLAMEEREGQEAVDKAERLKDRFGGEFAKILATFHPADLQEVHLDGSWDHEVPGKASNLKWAVAKAYESCQQDASMGVSNVVLTVADADVFFHPTYFTHITDEFCTMRAAPGEQHRWTMWQAPQLPYRNYYLSPAPARVWGYVSSLYEFGGVSSLLCGGHHMVFSAYSVHLQLAVDAQLWDGDVVAEDHHAYIKGFFYSAQASATEALVQQAQGIQTAGCQPALRVRPVMLPVKSTSVVHPEGGWKSWEARYHQARRHCQGVSELSYTLLATWDLLCTLPMSAYNLRFILHLGKVAVRPLFIHTIPLCQAMALGVLTLYWLIHRGRVPQCPDRISLASSDGEMLLCGLAGAWALTWPVLIPFTLLALANFLFIRVSFLKPATMLPADQRATLWHGSDGDIPPTCGSTTLTLALLILFDSIVLMAPLMVPYGLIPSLLAAWNVLVQGNHFTYVTATKATAIGRDYGSTGTGNAPLKPAISK